MTLATSREAVPFAPRKLTRSEQIRSDLYIYHSPKLARQVMVIRPTVLALALELEFSPRMRTYVERPRTLVFDGGKIELSFWTATDRGLEQFLWLTVAAPAKTGPSARGAERRLEAIQAAAQNAQIALTLVSEAQMARRPIENANRLRLLPWVQTARDLPQLAAICARALERFAYQARLSFAQLEHALSDYDARDVRAAACQLVHSGELTLDWSSKLHTHSLLERAVSP
jgi:hypothetical protein